MRFSSEEVLVNLRGKTQPGPEPVMEGDSGMR